MFASIGLPQNNPIVGIDIVVQKQPAGKGLMTSTSKSGKATTSKLTPGSYAVSMRLTAELVQQTAQPATAKAPATTGELIARITANSRTIEPRPISVGSATKPGLTDLLTKGGKKLVIKIKNSGSKKLVFRIEGHMGKAN